MKKAIVILSVLVLAGGSINGGEVSAGVDYRGNYSDNIFMNASAVNDFLNQFQADLSYSHKHLNLYLDVSAGIYVENPQFNSYALEPGIEGYFSLKGRNTVYFDLSCEVLHHKEYYTDFNYTGPRFRAGLKLYPGAKMILKAGYQLESRNYNDFQSFDFTNHTAFVELSRVFNGQTTVRLAFRYNYRSYPHVIDHFDFGENYNYFRRYKFQGGGSGNSGNGNGPGPGPNNPPGQYSTSSVAIPNLHGLLRITRGVGARLGITAEAEVRKNYSGMESAETIIKNAYVLYPFNDDFLWDGLRFGLTAKLLVGKALSVETQASYYDKGYRGVYNRDEDGNVVKPAIEREDSLWLFSLKLSRKFGKFDVSASASYHNNDSNDDYFLYNMLTISAGLGYRF